MAKKRDGAGAWTYIPIDKDNLPPVDPRFTEEIEAISRNVAAARRSKEPIEGPVLASPCLAHQLEMNRLEEKMSAELARYTPMGGSVIVGLDMSPEQLEAKRDEIIRKYARRKDRLNKKYGQGKYR